MKEDVPMQDIVKLFEVIETKLLYYERFLN